MTYTGKAFKDDGNQVFGMVEELTYQTPEGEIWLTLKFQADNAAGEWEIEAEVSEACLENTTDLQIIGGLPYYEGRPLMTEQQVNDLADKTLDDTTLDNWN